jgi:ERCC4-type nuclease
MTLETSDYAFLDRDNNAVGIERCEINNFVQKLASGELEAQMYRCASEFSTTVLLIEGIYNHTSGFLTTFREGDRGYFRNRISPHLRYDAVLASMLRLSEFGIELVHTPNFNCSMIAVSLLYIQRTESTDLSMLFRKIRTVKLPVKLSSNPAVPKLMALGSRVPEKVAIELIGKYGSIWNVLHTPDEELLQIKGFGKGLLESIKKGVGKEC